MSGYHKGKSSLPPGFINGHKRGSSSSFTELGLSISSNLTWKPYIHFIAMYASQKLGFLSGARGYFSPSQLLTIYKFQIRPSLEYCSHVWGGAPKSSLHLHDKVQSKTIRIINNPTLTSSLQTLSYRPLLPDLPILYRNLHRHCSLEIKTIITDAVRRLLPVLYKNYFKLRTHFSLNFQGYTRAFLYKNALKVRHHLTLLFQGYSLAFYTQLL